MTAPAMTLFQIGKSLFDEEGSKVIHKICDKAKDKGVNLHFSTDCIAASKFADDAEVDVYIVTDFEPGSKTI